MLKHYADLLNCGHISPHSSQPDDPLRSLSDSTNSDEEYSQVLELVAQSVSQEIADSVFEDREFIETRVTVAKRDHAFR